MPIQKRTVETADGHVTTIQDKTFLTVNIAGKRHFDLGQRCRNLLSFLAKHSGEIKHCCDD